MDVRSRINTSASAFANRSASASMSFTVSVKTVTSCAVNFAKQSRPRTAS